MTNKYVLNNPAIHC